MSNQRKSLRSISNGGWSISFWRITPVMPTLLGNGGNRASPQGHMHIERCIRLIQDKIQREAEFI